jgi:outer membrane biosynthesis protein TonB
MPSRQTKIADALLWSFIVAVCLIAGTLNASAKRSAQMEQLAPAPRVGLSLEIVTPTKGVDFSPYITKLIQSLKQNVQAHLPESASNGKKGIVTLQVQLQKDGSVAEGYPVAVTGVGVTTSAAYKEMEAASIAAVRATAPYGPLPEPYPSSTVMLKITFFFNIPPARVEHKPVPVPAPDSPRP